MMNAFQERLPLSRAEHDRDDAYRAQAVFPDSAAVLLVQRRDTVLIGPPEADGTLKLDLREPTAFREEHLAAGAIYLGKLTAERTNPNERVDARGTRVFAVSVSDFDAGQVEPDSTRWVSLREHGTALNSLDIGLATQALAMRNFHSAHRFSPSTAARCVSEHGGWVLRGEDGGAPIFPRTDPAVIAAVIDRDDRILLGANVNWTPKRYSLFAGFVEPGESLEQAVAREVQEESGARVVQPRYLGSQPWPFPASLMLGFITQLAPDQDPNEVAGDGNEIAEVRWFTREEIAHNVALLPDRLSIARAIIEHWYGKPL